MIGACPRCRQESTTCGCAASPRPAGVGCPVCDPEHDRLRCAHPQCGAITASIRWGAHRPGLVDAVFALVTIAFILTGVLGAHAWRALDPAIAVRVAADRDGLDPWRRPLERRVVPDPTVIVGTHHPALVYSRGPDGIDDGGSGDDVLCPPSRSAAVQAYELLPLVWVAVLLVLGTGWAGLRWVGRSRRRRVDLLVCAAQVAALTLASVPLVGVVFELWLPTLVHPIPRLTLVSSWTATLCTLTFVATIAVLLGRTRYSPVGLGVRIPY